MKNEARKLIKFGNYSLCITLPKKIIDEMKLKKGDSVYLSINKVKQQIVISLKGNKTNTVESKKTTESGTRW